MMSNEQALVSIIIPSRNRPELAKAAARSALDQTYRNIEVIVVDDGSEPPLGLDIQDARLKLVRNEKSVGGAAARNIGLSNASGDFLCLLDDDDYYYPNKVGVQLEYLHAHPQVDMVFSQLCRDDRQGTVVVAPATDYRFETLTNFLWPNKIHNNSTLFRRRVLDRVKFDERLTKYQDWQFNMTISLHFEVRYLPVCVGVWNRDRRSDRLALQGDLAKFRNFKLICEIFAPALEADRRLRLKYYRRLGYLALRAHDWRHAKIAYVKMQSWRSWPAFVMAIMKSYGRLLVTRAKRIPSGLRGESHA